MDGQFMDVMFLGPIFVLIGTVISGLMLLVGYYGDWVRADEVGPGPLHGRDQNP